MDVFQKHGRRKRRRCLSSLFANHQKQGEQHIEPAEASSETTCSPIRHRQSGKAPDQFCFGRERHQCRSRLVNLFTAADSTPAPEPSAKKIKLSLGALTSLKKPKERPSAARSPRDRLSAEIEQNLKYSVIDGDEDPLKWWKRNEPDFPLLSQLAKRYLAIQASSSPSERLFSKAGLVITPARAQLKPEKVDMLVFLAENL